jgi:hypothetical protein
MYRGAGSPELQRPVCPPPLMHEELAPLRQERIAGHHRPFASAIAACACGGLQGPLGEVQVTEAAVDKEGYGPAA